MATGPAGKWWLIWRGDGTYTKSAKDKKGNLYEWCAESWPLKIEFSEIVKHFLRLVCLFMGTGGLANLLYLLSSSLAFLKPIALILFWLNIVLFWYNCSMVLRWFIHFNSLLSDFKHPMISNFSWPCRRPRLSWELISLLSKRIFRRRFIDGLGLVMWIVGLFWH